MKKDPIDLAEELSIKGSGKDIVVQYYEHAITRPVPLLHVDPRWVREWLGGENSVRR
jgi:hypothetical protein